MTQRRDYSCICLYDCVLGTNLEQGLGDSRSGTFSLAFEDNEKYLTIPAKDYAKRNKGDSAHTM